MIFQNKTAGKKQVRIIIVLQLLLPLSLFAQTFTTQTISNYYKENDLYTNDSVAHTAWKPILQKGTTNGNTEGTWFNRKFFHEHLLSVIQPNFQLYGDAIFDECIGKSSRSQKTPNLNTRGYEVSGTIGEHFYFQTAFYENAARFGGYIDSFVRQNLVIPGQGGFKNEGDGKGFDYSVSTARLIYTPNKYVSFDFGYGKNFIGDGYRSLLLSDWSFNYPYFKVTTTFGRFQYNVMWSQYISQRNRIDNNKLGYYRKWSQTFLLDWKPTDKLAIGLFESVIWPDQDSMRHKDISPWLASPVMFLHGSKSPEGVQNFDITGLNASYKILNSTSIYAQFALDNLGIAGWEKRYAVQGGIRSANIFVNGLNVLVEGNMARPYTYASNSLNTNYAHNNQPLAHPLGANFKEGLGVVDFTYNDKWFFRLEGFIAQYGADSSAFVNYGQNIFKPLDTHTVTENTSIGEGLKTNIHFADLRVAYIINPVTNMRIEAGFTYRTERGGHGLIKYTDKIVSVGIKMGFRKIFYDY